jgi:hypothetical protein
MIFNGHTHDTLADLDDLTMAQIQTMYADGTIGNHGMIQMLSTLIAGVFNYMRPANSSSYRIESILGPMSEYLFPPLPEEYKKEQANNQLLTFMAQAPGFSKEKFYG